MGLGGELLDRAGEIVGGLRHRVDVALRFHDDAGGGLDLSRVSAAISDMAWVFFPLW